VDSLSVLPPSPGLRPPPLASLEDRLSSFPIFGKGERDKERRIGQNVPLGGRVYGIETRPVTILRARKWCKPIGWIFYQNIFGFGSR
jgi:hypothetical protein